MKNRVFLIAFFIFISGQAFAKNPVQTASSVDLNQYLGEWYEIATIPQSFQKKCVKNVKAQYSLTTNGLIKVVNSCETQSGAVKVANARARVVDKKTNAKLRVTFVKIFNWVFSLGGNYWILDVAPDYSYAVVGDPTTEYGWILSRTPDLGEESMNKAKKVLLANGYDICKFRKTIQDGGVDQNSFCL